MATGRLGIADLSAAADTSLYTVPADTFAVVTVSLCNRSTGTRSVRIAVASAATPTNAEYIEYDADKTHVWPSSYTLVWVDCYGMLVWID